MAKKQIARKKKKPIEHERARGAAKSNARKRGKEAAKSAKNSVRDAYKRNTENAKKQKQSGKTVGSHYGQVASRTTDTQKNRNQARKDLASGFHARTVGEKDKSGKTKVTNYVKQQQGIGKGKSASAYNKYKTAQTNREEEGKVTVHTKSPLTIATQTAMEGVRNVSSNVSEASKWYDKEEKKAQKEGMTYGDKKEFIKKWVTDPSNAEYLKNYKKSLEENSTYSYTKAPTDSNKFFQEAVASQPAFAYQKVKTETDIPVYQTDKEGNVKYDKDGNPIAKRNKEGDIVYQKVDTTIGNNILNARAGGFDKNGRLTSMEGSEKMGSQTAGALRDAKFFGGVLQGTSYGDITRGLGTYSNAAATDLDNTKQSGAFNAGYGVGIMAQFGLSGINLMAKSLLSEGLKSVPKALAKNAGLSAALDTPLNVADAVKMGTDSRGNINPASVGMYFGINTLMSGLMPAGIEGIGAGITHAQSKELLGLLAREESLVKAGKALSPQDAMRRDDLLAKQARTAEGQVSAAGIIAGKTFDEITGKGGNATVNGIRAKVMVDPKKALAKIPTDGTATSDDLISIGAVKEIARKRGDYQTAAEAELKLRDIKDGLDPEMKKQVDEMMKQVDSTRKIENANIVREADAENIVAKAADKDKKVTGRVLEELEGAVEYAKQAGNKQLEANAREALNSARIENKKYIEGINKRYQQLGEKLNIPIKAGTKRDLDDVLRANNIRIPEKEYGGFVLRDSKTKKVREIYVNADSPDSVAFAIGHEVAHVMEVAGEDYRVFRNLLKGYDGGRIWDEEASKVIDLYAGVKGADYDRETTANVLGRILTSDGETFLDNVFREDRTLFEKLYDFIRRLLHGSEEASEDLTKIETKMRDILNKNGGATLRDEEFGDSVVSWMMIDDSANVAAGISGIRKTNPSTGKITEETIKTTERGSKDAQKKLETLLSVAKRTGKTSREDIIKIHDKVRRETGWFVGADGTWQFEINDAPARFNIKLTPRKHGFTDADKSKLATIEQQLRDGKLSKKDRETLLEEKRNLSHSWGTKDLYSAEGADLKDVLHHPELFRAYKKLEHYKVHMEDMGEVKIRRDESGNITGLSAAGAYGERTNKGVSLNYGILSVPKGESLADYATAVRRTADEYGISLPSPKDFEGLSKDDLLALIDDKGIKIKGKVKRGGKSVTLNRKNAREEDLIKLLSVEDKDVPQEFLMGTLLHEVQHKIQLDSKMSGGGLPELWYEKPRQIFDKNGKVLHTYEIRDFTIARNPKDQAKLMQAKAARLKAQADYKKLASGVGAALDSNDLEFLELSILKAFPKQAEKAIKNNDVNAYVSLMMSEIEDMAKLDKGLLPFNAKFPESPMLNISMMNYFNKSFEAYRLAEHPHGVYSDLIGEQQSRMVQHRRKLTPKERTEEFPLDTDATYRFVDMPEMRGLSKLPKPTTAEERIVQNSFEKKYPHSQVNEEGKLKYEADFSILDKDEKIVAEREARAKSQAETVKRVREAVAEEAKKASAYGKDKEVYPLREQTIIKAFNDAYDERTGTVKWGEVYKALKDDPNFSQRSANSVRNRIKAVFNEQTVTVTKSEAKSVERSEAKTASKPKKKAETVESKEDFRSEFEGEARAAENEMSDEEFFRGLEAPQEEPVVEANWNEAVPVPKDTKAINEVKGLYEQLDATAQKLKTATSAEKRMAIEKERTSINEQIEALVNENEAVKEYNNLYKALDNASTEEERTAIREELARMESGGAKMPQVKEKAPQPPKPKQEKPKKQKQAKPKQEAPKQESPAKPKRAKQSQKSEIKPKEQRVAETLERQKAILEQEEKALAKAKTPEEKRLAQRRLGLAKGRVRKAQNALDALKKEKPPKAEAEITPLPKGESMPEPPSGKSAEFKEKMPSFEQIIDNAKKGYISTHEIGEHAKRLKEDWSNELDITKKAFREAVKNGELGSKVGRDISYNEAFKKASADIEKDWGKVYDRVMNRDPYIVETTQSVADKDALFQYLVMKAGTSEGEEAEKFAMLHIKVMDKMDEAASLGGHMLQLQSYILRNSPEGRVRWVAREVARLTKEYEKQLKGKKIEISAAQIKAILEAKSAKEIADVMEETGKMIWKQIPAGFFEASNQIRHFAMLFNPKTHARNVFGNTVFLGARALSDIAEVGMTKAFGRRLKSLSQIDQYESLIKDLEEQAKNAQPKEKQAIKGKIRETEKLLEAAKADANSPMKQFLANGEVSGCKKLLDERFEADYATNGGQNVGKWKEGRRSAGYVYEQSGNKVKDTLAKGMNKLIDLNYNLLDREDRWYFRPAYERAYVRWCKSRGLVEEVGGRKIVTPKALEKMSDAEMQEATAYAMQQAKIATFRDDSAVSDRIIAWKQATEGKKGEGLGTIGYRTLNVGLESVLPFVKTPVNIMRRGMDYSPIGMFRGLADSILAKDSQTFMRGIHEMSTGLTGTGICVLGMWAASHDWVTVHTGEVSGDEYYDRDMGYQDFSVNILGHSVSFDWMAPVQFSFFQGAALYKEWCEDKGVSMEMLLKGLEAGAMPMLEMSFMSSAKDTVTSFMERAYRDGTGSEANAAQAIGRTLFGTLPQDWLSGFVPQLSSQFAGYFDEKQRDTSSTLEDEWQRSWESFGRKMLNRLPYFRESLMPKVDRTGQDIETDIHYFDDKNWNPKLEEGMNVLAKFAMSFAMPPNVKKITLDKYDQAVIDPLGSDEIDAKTKEYVGLDLTGNPSYDRGEDLSRMTYEERYDYLRTKRQDQWDKWKKAVDSKSFNDMTDQMKLDELKDYHFISTVTADRTVYNDEYAKNKILEKGTENGKSKDEFTPERELWKNMKHLGGTAKDFVDAYTAVETVCARAHNSDYHTQALAIQAMDKSEKKKDVTAKAYKIYGDKLDPANTFLSKYKSAEKALMDYTNAYCSGESICEKEGVSDSRKNLSLAFANVEGGVPEKVYRAGGYDWNSAQAGGGLKKYGYTYESLAQMDSDAIVQFDADNNNRLNKEELITYIESLGIDSQDEKACIFEYFKPSANSRNPYGTIADHLEWGTTPDAESGSGRRGRGRRGGRGGRGGGSGGSGMSWEEWLKQQGLSQASKAGGSSRRVGNNTSESLLNEAYRKRLTKNIRATSKKH